MRVIYGGVQRRNVPMNDPKETRNDAEEATPLSGSSDDLDDTASTMQLRAIKLESELWPDDTAVDPDEDDGVDPYNTGRFDRSKNS